MTTKAVHRYEVPVDDRAHAHTLTGKIVHVDSRTRGIVEFWAIHTDANPIERRFRVYGTGHAVPAGLDWCGTAIDGPFVWHLFEVPQGATA